MIVDLLHVDNISAIPWWEIEKVKQFIFEMEIHRILYLMTFMYGNSQHQQSKKYIKDEWVCKRDKKYRHMLQV